MKSGPVIALIIAVLLLNAGITIMLISSKTIGSNAATARAAVQQTELSGRNNSITRAVAAVEPAVVSINVIKTESVRPSSPFGSPFFDFFDLQPLQRQVQGIGTGVIYDSAGFIITNAHVVKGATQIKAILPDKREFDAEIVSLNDKLDVAKLKINGSNLPHAKLGKSRDLIIGEWVIALGNPYGMLMNDSNPTVSVGVISALKRSFAPQRDGRQYRNMIQTDAAINPGNSGGPLVNIDGEVVGINTFIFSDTGANVGIGFAIPVETVKSALAAM